MLRVKVHRLVLSKVHPNHDAKEGRNDRHFPEHTVVHHQCGVCRRLLGSHTALLMAFHTFAGVWLPKAAPI